MSHSARHCVVVMYHYVRQASSTPFRGLKGLSVGRFRNQVDFLRNRYEMATLESAMAFWRADYFPSRDLCLLTFDDGIQDHYTNVLPILSEARIQGLFFIITSCVADKKVMPVHKNQFLLASCDFDEYRRAFLERLLDLEPDVDTIVDDDHARSTYMWDSLEVARFKVLINHKITAQQRDAVLDALFRDRLGNEVDFAEGLYLSWQQVRTMQKEGMLVGGHSHTHRPLARLRIEQAIEDLNDCSHILRLNTAAQTLWPFSYPYGKGDTFNDHIIQSLKTMRFDCAFTTMPGVTGQGDDIFALSRTDTNAISGEKSAGV